MWERKLNEWHHILLFFGCFTFSLTTRGVNVYFERVSESGLPDCCALYMSSSAASHILFKNKTHILSLWVITSEKLNTADVSKIYTSIPVQLAKPPNYYVDEMMRLLFFFQFFVGQIFWGLIIIYNQSMINKNSVRWQWVEIWGTCVKLCNFVVQMSWPAGVADILMNGCDTETVPLLLSTHRGGCVWFRCRFVPAGGWGVTRRVAV